MNVWKIVRLSSLACVAFISLTVSATPITYNFSVTGTSGPLTGVTANGSFSYDSSIVLPNTILNATGLLTALNFTWDGITYNATTANTGALQFGAGGTLSGALFGTSCLAGFCTVVGNQEQWFASLNPEASSSLVYATPTSGLSGASATISGPVTVPEPATLALLGLGLFGVALARRKPH